MNLSVLETTRRIEAKPKNISDPCLSLRPREAAAALGISERLLWSLTASGQIPHLKVGRAKLYPVNVLTDWLTRQAEGKVKTPRPKA